MNFKPIMRLLCHQREDRTYKVCNDYMIVCARCFGIYAGFIFSLPILLLIYGFFTRSTNFLFAFALIVPLGIDGVTQIFGLRESKNWLRFATGYLAGLSMAYIFYSLAAKLFFFSKTETLFSFELIPLVSTMLVLLIVLEKSANSKNIFLRKFFNFAAIFSALILVFGIAIFYGILLVKRFF